MFDLVRAKYETDKTVPRPLANPMIRESIGSNTDLQMIRVEETNKPNYALMGLGLLIFVCSISLIIYGIIHFNDCPAEKLISISYIVIGGLIFLSRLINSYHDFLETMSGSNIHTKPRVLVILTIILQLILLGCFFAESYWVFSIKPHINTDDPTSPNYCDEDFYENAFWGTTITLVTLGGLFILACTTLCYLRCRNSTSNNTEPLLASEPPLTLSSSNLQ